MEIQGNRWKKLSETECVGARSGSTFECLTFSELSLIVIQMYITV